MKQLNLIQDNELFRSFLVDQIFTAPTFTAISGLGWNEEDLGTRGLFFIGPLTKSEEGWRADSRPEDHFPERSYTLTEGHTDPGSPRPDRETSWKAFQYGVMVEYGATDPGELLP